MRPLLLALTAVLACWSGVAFGETRCDERCRADIETTLAARAELLARDKEDLRQSDPKLLAVLEKRFPKMEEIERCGDDQCSWISVYTPSRIWACDITRNPLKLRCRTRHQ
jgi:hypothetical protein